jgi:hypothetical protein
MLPASGSSMKVNHLKRREFITLLGGAAAWPLAARAQQPARPSIGFLSALGRAQTTQHIAMFGRGLGETGIVDGQNVTIEYRFAEGKYDRLPALAAELVRRAVTLIAAASPPAPSIADARRARATGRKVGACLRCFRARARLQQARDAPPSLVWPRQESQAASKVLLPQGHPTGGARTKFEYPSG